MSFTTFTICKITKNLNTRVNYEHNNAYYEEKFFQFLIKMIF